MAKRQIKRTQKNKKIVIPDKIKELAAKNKTVTNKKGEQGKFVRLDLQLVYRLALLGLSNAQIAEALCIEYSQFAAWLRPDAKNALYKPELLVTLHDARYNADAVVAERLYERAKGYSHKEDKFFVVNNKIQSVSTTKHYAPDVAAAMFILKNKRPDQWKERQEAPQPTGFNISAPTVNIITDNEKIEKLMADKNEKTKSDQGGLDKPSSK